MTEILTIDSVAQILRCEEKTVAERLVSGSLPGIKFGRSWIIPSEALFQRINEMAIEEAAERRRTAEPGIPAQQDAPKKRGRKRFPYSALA